MTDTPLPDDIQTLIKRTDQALSTCSHPSVMEALRSKVLEQAKALETVQQGREANSALAVTRLEALNKAIARAEAAEANNRDWATKFGESELRIIELEGALAEIRRKAEIMLEADKAVGPERYQQKPAQMRVWQKWTRIYGRELLEILSRPSGESGPDGKRISEMGRKPEGRACLHPQCDYPVIAEAICDKPDCPFAQDGPQNPAKCPVCDGDPQQGEDEACAIAECPFAQGEDGPGEDPYLKGIMDKADHAQPSEAPEPCPDCDSSGRCTHICDRVMEAKQPDLSPPPDRRQQGWDRYKISAITFEADTRIFVVNDRGVLMTSREAVERLRDSLSEVDDLKYQVGHVEGCNDYLVKRVERLRKALESTTTNGHYNECLAGQRGYGECSAICQQVRAALQETDND